MASTTAVLRRDIPRGQGMANAKPITSRAADSPSLRRVAIFRSMPQPDLTPEEYAEIVRLAPAAIDGERYILSPRVKRLKSILVKLDPAPSATVTPYPAPRPSAEPSHLYAKLSGSRRRR